MATDPALTRKVSAHSIRTHFQSYENYVKIHPALRHPFLYNFHKLEVSGLRRFLKEQYHLSTTLPRALAVTYSLAKDCGTNGELIPGWKISAPLLAIIAEEAWGIESPDAHSRYFLELAQSLDISVPELISHRSHPATEEFTETRLRICRTSFVKALGALGLANELSNFHIFELYLEGAKRISREVGVVFPLGYFEVHVRDELPDYEKFLAMILPYLRCSDGGKVEKEVFDGMRELLDARIKWYDALFEFLIPA